MKKVMHYINSEKEFVISEHYIRLELDTALVFDLMIDLFDFFFFVLALIGLNKSK